MAFTGRPNVTDTERKRMEKASGPKFLMLKAIKTMIKYNPEILPGIMKAQEFDKNPMPAPKRDTNFDKWQKKNRGL